MGENEEMQVLLGERAPAEDEHAQLEGEDADLSLPVAVVHVQQPVQAQVHAQRHARHLWEIHF